MHASRSPEELQDILAESISERRTVWAQACAQIGEEKVKCIYEFLREHEVKRQEEMAKGEDQDDNRDDIISTFVFGKRVVFVFRVFIPPHIFLLRAFHCVCVSLPDHPCIDVLASGSCSLLDEYRDCGAKGCTITTIESWEHGNLFSGFSETIRGFLLTCCHYCIAAQHLVAFSSLYHGLKYR